MIRRNYTRDDGTSAWILISQIEHARVAGELATDWGSLQFDAYPCPDVVLPTIFHHDDGWEEWEAHPTIDPSNGKPRAFTEMPNDVAHEIWRRSIAGVERWGPLAQYMVAEHFMHLRRGGDETDQADVQAFLSEFDTRCERWRSEFLRDSDFSEGSRAPQIATDYLQMFDLFSLYLCCTPPEQAYELEIPAAGKLTVNIASVGVVVDPWPWKTPEKVISTAGAMVDVQRFSSNEQLWKEMANRRTTLTWKLSPRSESTGK